MNLKRNVIASVLLSCVAVFSEPKAPSVYLHETFGEYAVGAAPLNSALRRVEQVSVVDGAGRVGEGKVAHYNDSGTEGGVMEYNVGPGGLGGLFIEFDLLNNKPGEENGSSPIIFAVGPWNPSRGKCLGANARRAFGLEFYQTGISRTIALRVGKSAVQRGAYDLAAPQHVKVWVNDHDKNTLSYVRPDTGETVALNPDSLVVWINGKPLAGGPVFGYAMQKSVSAGDKVIGRVGFSSTTEGTADFLIDNLYVEDPTGESVSVAAREVVPSATEEATPVRMAGAETMAYREGEAAMNLFVYKPEGWKPADRRPALVYFFGGGWTKGTPLKSASWAAWAASKGMVGIAPDYRTKNRFGTSPLSSVADGRAAFNWVAGHAAELGIDPGKIVVGGASAGGHIALWTAIEGTPPGSNPAESPKVKPAAIFLSSAVTDTSETTGYTPSRFGEDARALSPVHRLDEKMPPVLMFHAADDALVDYRTAVALHDALKASGNACELVTVPQGGHGYSRNVPEWKTKVRVKVEQFLRDESLLPVVPAPNPAP